MGQSPKVVLNENIENSIEFHQGKLMFTENEISYSNKYTINPCKKTNVFNHITSRIIIR